MVLIPVRARDERGVAAVLVALVFSVLVVVMALVVDLGMARDTRRVSQNSADASALAGVNALYPSSDVCSGGGPTPCTTDAIAAVKQYAAENFQVTATDWSACTASPPTGYAIQGGTSCIAFNNASNPTRVWVRIPDKRVATAFGRITGRGDIAVGSTAEAQVGLDVDCSLCFLNGVDAGNGDFSVYGGSIAVNGNVNAGPNSNWFANTNGIVGTVSGGIFSPPPTPISPFADPFGSFALPLSTTGLPTGRTDPCKTSLNGGGPGIYDQPVEIPNNGTCTLQPGLYVINNAWSMKNNSLLAGVGITLYVKKTGSIDFKNGWVDITGHAPEVSPEDFAILYDRDATSDLSLQGNGLGDQITGSVYLPSAKMYFNGNSCFGFTSGPVVAAGIVQANGNKSCMTINFAKKVTVSRGQMHLSE